MSDDEATDIASGATSPTVASMSVTQMSYAIADNLASSKQDKFPIF